MKISKYVRKNHKILSINQEFFENRIEYDNTRGINHSSIYGPIALGQTLRLALARAGDYPG